MKTCIKCRHANWKKTAKGKLHPSGDGRCEYKYFVPALPNSMYWLYWLGSGVIPLGGIINRKKEYNKDCPYYLREDL